jgi:hypothetical protein
MKSTRKRSEIAKNKSRLSILRVLKAGEAVTAATLHIRLGDRTPSAVKGACTRLVESGHLEVVGKEWSKFGPANLYARPGTTLADLPSQGQRKLVGQPVALIELLTPPLPQFRVLQTRKHRLAHDEAAI